MPPLLLSGGLTCLSGKKWYNELRLGAVFMFTKEEIQNQLRQLNSVEDAITLVHTSMRAVGKVEGGAEGLLDALIEHFTRGKGLLCIPTHTWHHLENS